MMEKLLETRLIKRKGLWISYIKETNISRATAILKRWSRITDEIFRMQTILFLDQQFNV